jgi:hypothetical protein
MKSFDYDFQNQYQVYIVNFEDLCVLCVEKMSIDLIKISYFCLKSFLCKK